MVHPAIPISPANLSREPLPSTSSYTIPTASFCPLGGFEGGGGGGGGGTGAGGNGGGAGGGTGAGAGTGTGAGTGAGGGGHLLACACATAAAPRWLLPFWPACGVFLHLLALLLPCAATATSGNAERASNTETTRTPFMISPDRRGRRHTNSTPDPGKNRTHFSGEMTSANRTMAYVVNTERNSACLCRDV